jgi:hypothetical protein
MRILRLCFAVLAAGIGLSAVACDNPEIVKVPDGEKASMDELLQAQGQVKSYMTAMQAYLDCLDNELDAAGDDAPAQYKSLMVTRHNAAVTEMEAVASAFNDQVKAYKTANPDSQ